MQCGRSLADVAAVPLTRRRILVLDPAENKRILLRYS